MASATLAGTVVDESSAVVGGASIVAAQPATGFSRATVSDPRGDYLFDQLPPGTYTITARKPGFRVYEASQVALEVNQKARHDIRLAVGAGQETITVEAAVSPVDSGGASVGYRMDNSQDRRSPSGLAQRGVAGDPGAGRHSAPARRIRARRQQRHSGRHRAARWRSTRPSTAAAPP